MQRTDDADGLAVRRATWTNRGERRPGFAIEPTPEQESVWDYPRPPRVEPERRPVVVRHGGVEVARTDRALRVLETASPPVVYVPPEDVRMELLRPNGRTSLCEWKGRAVYFDVATPSGEVTAGAWAYPDPFDGYQAIAGYVSFYPGLLECRLGGERVRPQAGGFYGGWVTDEIVGPFKGESGTAGW